jgi:hypothetical protein
MSTACLSSLDATEPLGRLASSYFHLLTVCIYIQPTRIYVLAQVGPPFPFHSLPPELRVRTYRDCLTAYKPIHPYSPKGNPHINCPSRLATGLQGTCAQINSEAARVLYGENEFRFLELYGHVSLLRFLKHIGSRNSVWLARVTMNTPFMGKQVYEYWRGWAVRTSSYRIGHVYPPSLEWSYDSYYLSNGYPVYASIEGTSWGSLCEEVM